MDVARLLVQVDANTAAAEAGLASLHKSVALAAIGFGVLVAAVAVAGVVAVKMAGDFQAGLTTLVTSAGESAKNLKMVGDGIKQIAVDTGTSTTQLIAGLYMINSAGYRGAEGLKVLRVAAEGARAENADLSTVSDALTTVLKDYPNVVGGATGAMNALIGATANGKTHLQDLAGSLAMVLPTASVARISLNDVMGAMAAMTAKGVPAANAATYLRQTILGLMAPGAAAKSALEGLGLSADAVATEMQKSMPTALQMIIDALSKKFPPGSAAFIAALKDISGGAKTAQGMMLLAGQGTQAFSDSVAAVAKQVTVGGKSVLGWNEVQKTFNFQWSKFLELLQTGLISLGQKLLPVLTQVVTFMVDHAVPAVTGLTQFWKDHQAIIIIVAAVIAGALAASFIVWAVTAGAAAVATIAATWPVLAIGAAIALLVVGLIYAYTHWGWFKWAIDQAAIGAGEMKDDLGDLIGWLGRLSEKIGGLLGDLGKLKDAAANALPAGLGSFISNPHLPGYASGTGSAPGGAAMLAEGGGPELVMRPGVYNVPRGSTVLNARDTAKALGGGGGTTNYYIYPAKSQFDAQEMDRLQRRRALLSSRAGGFS